MAVSITDEGKIQMFQHEGAEVIMPMLYDENKVRKIRVRGRGRVRGCDRVRVSDNAGLYAPPYTLMLHC